MPNKQVLLIEDEPHIAEAIRFILSRAGWAVSVLGDGAQAMSRIAEVLPDAIILDLMLPGRSGLEILSDLRADADLSRLPVLMLSARGQGRDREAAERAGATAFLAKPFANADVLARLEAITGGGEARREPA
ncbi:MAG: response regulator [Thioclava marina]|jgi:response regulator receiver protein|uniref:Two-component system response regulator n=1 Tax=Thioclava marina TaxID=1915077 RepID=A0ABX3MPF5_9RHOB|nr:MULTISPECIES: response regulator [Thioclava]TNE94437.1 MAG: response regulator transcription factor [Paracoccaceae bacterium]MBC7146544.1 response regulator [Thioclava marina]MBD3804150.1 response regulator [Thioclava sp.]OOY13028.1 two-component system response regulator [Thioclava marina]OOY28742.1 two-component system response regulator [Thioclava sp. L04-15]